ncbi:MAG: MFS transporter [Burkholderiales bacterium]|nr:MFS transporter [Burkholderiales bacterium]
MPRPTHVKIFYGWRIVFAAGAIQFLLAALLQSAFGAYVAVLADEQGWSKTALSGAAALQSLEAALLGPLLGWIIDRSGARRMIIGGVVVFAAGFVFLSRIGTLGEFYFAVVLLAVGASFCGYFPLTVAVVQWFERMRARALSATAFGFAAGGLAVPLVAWSMQVFGWRATALGSGILVLVVGLPLALTIRSRPEDQGETVDGLPPAPPPATGMPPPVSAQREFTWREAVRTRAFWLISLGHGAALLVVTGVNVHAITHMKEGLGYTVAQASLVITLMNLAQAGGVALGYMVGDRFEKRFVAATCMVLHGAGLIMLTFASGWTMLIAFAALHGVAWGLRGPFMQAIRADYFGRSAIGMIMGLAGIITALGQIGGPMIAGAMADWTGNYRAGFTLLALLSMVGSLFFVLARRPH